MSLASPIYSTQPATGENREVTLQNAPSKKLTIIKTEIILPAILLLR